MQIDYDHSIGKPTKPDEVDDLLWGRMKIMGLDVDAIGREFREVFDKIKRNCPSCSDREACALDLKRDPKDIRHINRCDWQLLAGGWCSSIQDGTGHLECRAPSSGHR